MPTIEINLDGENAWPDLQDQEVLHLPDTTTAPTRDQRVVTYVCPADADQLDRIATERDISRSAAARQLLRQALAALPGVA